jgi:tripartite-type tricarboxylate transporter receptor subunit TctC
MLFPNKNLIWEDSMINAKTVSIGVALAATLATWGQSTVAQDYKGKTINMLIASNAGGGTDRIGRLFGLYLEKYLPGKPNIVYRNFAAGGGKIRAANFLALQAMPDGFTIMQTDASVATPSTVRRKVSKYDPRTFHPIGGFNAGGSVVFARKGIKERLTSSGKPLIVGAISGSRSWQAMTVWGKEYLGWNLRWIPGYKGTRQLMKALRQGEIDIMATASSKRIDGLLKDGVIDLIAQEGVGGGQVFKARAAYPDVPVFPTLLKQKKLSPRAWDGYVAWIGPSQVDKWLTLPPKTPKAHVDAHRAAFNKVVADKKFLKLLKKQFSKDTVIMSGEEIAGVLDSVMKVSDESIKFSLTLRKKFNISSR